MRLKTALGAYEAFDNYWVLPIYHKPKTIDRNLLKVTRENAWSFKEVKVLLKAYKVISLCVCTSVSIIYIEVSLGDQVMNVHTIK